VVGAAARRVQLATQQRASSTLRLLPFQPSIPPPLPSPRQEPPGAVRAVAAARQVQDAPGPHAGRREEARRVMPPHRQAGARAVPLQRPRRPAPHRQRRDLGLQQPLHAVHPALNLRAAGVAGDAGDLRPGLQRGGADHQQVRFVCEGRATVDGGAHKPHNPASRPACDR
jgi:hypothetical protein